MAKDPESCPAHAALEDTVNRIAEDVLAIKNNVCGPMNGSALGLGEQVRDNRADIIAIQSQIGAVRSGIRQIVLSCIPYAVSTACGAVAGALAAVWATLKLGG